MDEPEVADSFFEILVRRLIGISISEVDAGRADAVHNHLGDVAARHWDAFDDGVTIDTVINPVFKMMFVAPFMVHPGF